MSYPTYTETEHVLPPDPANYWQLKIGEPAIISTGLDGKPNFTLVLVEVEKPMHGAPQKALFEMWVEHIGKLMDWLHMDEPIVALRTDNGEPMVTFTLRDINMEDVAFIQISAHPSVGIK